MNKYTFSTQKGKAYYCNSIPGFIRDTSSSIVGQLVRHSFEINKEQSDAWENQIQELQRRLNACGMEGDIIFEYDTQTSHMKNMSFPHNHTALSNKHYQAADFCSALRIYSGSLLTKSCAITCSCLSVAWNTVLILASITSCKIIMDCWNVTSAISFTIR